MGQKNLMTSAFCCHYYHRYCCCYCECFDSHEPLPAVAAVLVVVDSPAAGAVKFAHLAAAAD